MDQHNAEHAQLDSRCSIPMKGVLKLLMLMALTRLDQDTDGHCRAASCSVPGLLESPLVSKFSFFPSYATEDVGHSSPACPPHGQNPPSKHVMG